MATPKPGTTVRGSATGRAIMALLDLLGRRWCLRILWELHQCGPSSFRNLQQLCGGISPTILNTRLADLREAGIVDLRQGEGYVITAQGVALGKIIEPFNAWSKTWAEQMEAAGTALPGKTPRRAN